MGRRGPSAAAYVKVGDHWVWFQRIAEQRKQRETDPVLPLIEQAGAGTPWRRCPVTRRSRRCAAG
jgi:hypothetical protein